MHYMDKNVRSTQILEVSLLVVGAVLQLERDMWAIFK